MGTLIDISDPVGPGLVKDLKDVPYAETYVLGAKDFGAGNWTELILTPSTHRGYLKSVVIYEVSEVFSTTTTEATLNVGIASDADLYATTPDFGALAVAATLRPALTRGTTVIEPGTSIQVQGIAPTGGTPTGIATVALTIVYFK